MRRVAVFLSLFAAFGAILLGASDYTAPRAARAASFAPATAGMCTPVRPYASGTTVLTMSTADGMREYRLHVPASYTGADAVPLVFDLHGATSTDSAQEFYSAFSTKADANGFIVVYPQGLTTSFITYTHWNALLLPSPEPNDLAFITTLLDTLEAQLCIDPARVYSTGMSNGAVMSVRLACSLSSRIAAIAPVAGTYYPPLTPNFLTETCPDATGVPLLAFHGTADTLVPFNGGLGGVTGTTNFRLPIDNDTPAEDVIADWSTHNGCNSGRQESQVSSEVRLVQYTGCTLGAIVQLYVVDGGGHTWPGAINNPSLGYTTHEISATDLMWSFFVAHPMAVATPPSVGGVAEPPRLDAVPLAATTANGSDRTPFLAGASLAAMAAALGASGWYLRRRVRR